MSQAIIDEEKDKIRKEYYKAGGINMESYADWLMEKTANLISSKKDAECEKRLDKYNDDLIKDLKKMGFNSLSDVSFKFKEKDAEIEQKYKGWKSRCLDYEEDLEKAADKIKELVEALDKSNVLVSSLQNEIKKLSKNYNDANIEAKHFIKRYDELKSNLEEGEKAKDWIINQGVRQIKSLNKQFKNSIPKKCSHKGCKDTDLIVACHNHINSDYPCIYCL